MKTNLNFSGNFGAVALLDDTIEEDNLILLAQFIATSTDIIDNTDISIDYDSYEGLGV